MKITERQLRSIITKTMNEMHHDVVELPQLQHSDYVEDSHSLSGDHLMLQKARACMQMDAQKLFTMCAIICSKNPEMGEHCKRLLKCVCDGEIAIEDCCDCLTQICACPECCSICDICCK